MSKGVCVYNVRRDAFVSPVSLEAPLEGHGHPPVVALNVSDA